MVAKSYKDLPQIGEPYKKNNKMYVKVKTKSGIEKEVRWYTLIEYKKMYPDEDVTQLDEYYKPQKQIFGFDNGFIYLMKGNTETDEVKEWCRYHGAGITRLWGRYWPSNKPLWFEAPEGIELVKLDWELVGNEDGSLKSDDICMKVADELIGKERFRWETYLA